MLGHRQSLSFLAPGTGFTENHFSTVWGGAGMVWDDSWTLGLPWWLRQQSMCLQCRTPGFDPCVRKILWRRQWQLTPVLLPGESHGRRSLISSSPWDRKELDTMERFYFLHVHLSCTLFLLILLLHQLHLRSSDFRFWRLGTPGIEDPELSLPKISRGCICKANKTQSASSRVDSRLSVLVHCW